MTATRKDIEDWLEEAKDKKATHLIIAVDTFDYDNYPIFIYSKKECQEKINEINGKNMQRIDEVYKMNKNIDKQLKERRVWNV